MTADVDVVIVTYQSADHVARCIDAVADWECVSSITVVDNASTDASAVVASRCADRVVRMSENAGFGAGQNAGVATGTAAFLLLLNPDAVVQPASLDRGLSFLRANPGVAAVQGEVRRTVDGELERSSGPEPGLADLVSRLFRLRERLGEERLKRLAAVAGARYFAER